MLVPRNVQVPKLHYLWVCIVQEEGSARKGRARVVAFERDRGLEQRRNVGRLDSTVRIAVESFFWRGAKEVAGTASQQSLPLRLGTEQTRGKEDEERNDAMCSSVPVQRRIFECVCF